MMDLVHDLNNAPPNILVQKLSSTMCSFERGNHTQLRTRSVFFAAPVAHTDICNVQFKTKVSSVGPAAHQHYSSLVLILSRDSPKGDVNSRA